MLLSEKIRPYRGIHKSLPLLYKIPTNLVYLSLPGQVGCLLLLWFLCPGPLTQNRLQLI